MKLAPTPGYALVQLGTKYANLGDVGAKSYEGKGNGILISVCLPPGVKDELEFWGYHGPKGTVSRVFWEEMREGTPIERDSTKYAFIRLSDIQGWEPVDAE